MINSLRTFFTKETPTTSVGIRGTLGLDGLVRISGSTSCSRVVSAAGQDVGLMIPLVGQRRAVVVREDPRHDGYFRVRLVNETGGVLDTLSRVPAYKLFETCMDAAHTGSMEAF